MVRSSSNRGGGGSGGTAARAPPPPSAAAKYFGITIVVGMVAAAAMQIYMVLFPLRINSVALTDKVALTRTLYGGEPHLVVCANDTRDSRIRAAVEKALPALSGIGVTAVAIDCDTAYGDKPSLATRLRLQRTWRPTMLLAVNGRKPEQLSPSLLSPPTALVEQIKPQLVNRVGRIGNAIDLDNCVRDRAGGCLILYAPRSREEAIADLEGLKDAVRSVKLAAMDARTVIFQGKARDGPFQRMINAAVKAARTAAAVLDVPGQLLLHIQPVHGSGGSTMLATASHLADAAVVTASDVSKALNAGKAALAIATGASKAPAGNDGGSSDDNSAPVDVDVLLEREDRLLDRSAALFDRGEVLVVAPSKAKRPAAGKTPDPAATADSTVGSGSRARDMEGGTAEQRRARRAAIREEEGAAQPTPSLTPEQLAAVEAAWERRRREAMAQEEAESGHYAHAVADDDDANGGFGSFAYTSELDHEGEAGSAGAGSAEDGAEEVAVLDDDGASEGSVGGGDA